MVFWHYQKGMRVVLIPKQNNLEYKMASKNLTNQIDLESKEIRERVLKNSIFSNK